MGFNSVFLVLNDHIDDIKRAPHTAAYILTNAYTLATGGKGNHTLDSYEKKAIAFEANKHDEVVTGNSRARLSYPRSCPVKP